MSDNKMYSKPMYKCAICDTIHELLEDRIACEMKCFKKQEAEKKQAAIQKKKEEQAARKKEVDEAIAHAEKLKDQYVKDYGPYVRVRTCHVDELDELLSFADLFRMMP